MLDYELIPARERNSRKLMVMLHGLGDSIEGYRWWPEAMGLPWLNYVLVNAPDEYYGGFSWYDFMDDPLPGIERSRKMLGDLLDHFRAQGFASEATTLGGFSQGCLMSIETGLRYPHRLAGIVGISGYVAEPERLLTELSPVARQQRLLITHGTLDPVVPFARTREHVNLLKAEGLKIEWHEFVKPHTIAGDEELEVIRNFIRASHR
ncbi:MAG: serine esterase [Verrucomicrobia bacterium]|nr:MAG: serine esterase [Verrucomicrobiota bacterium]